VTQGRGLGGVARGLAQHLGLPVATVRWALAGSIPVVGIGAAFYLFLWLTVPPGDAGPAGPRAAPAILRLRWTRVTAAFVAGSAILLLAVLLAAQSAGWNVRWEWWLPAGALVGGIGLVWSQLERDGRSEAMRRGLGALVTRSIGAADAEPQPAAHPLAAGRTRPGYTPVSVVRLMGGVVLVITGVVLLTWQNQPVGSLGYAVLAGIAVVAGVATVLAPWWLRLLRELGDERAARAREAERADIAAHLHDSVLQTLAVLRAQADDPDTVRRLARAQERELRHWLYETGGPASASLATGLKEVVAQVEDATGIAIGTVVVGDQAPGPAGQALLRAAREALTNAARHGRPPIDVYLEVSDAGVEAYVRDRGSGFDVDAIGPDRFGVRESILGRMARAGGDATVHRARGGGTEVRLMIPAIQPGGGT
jgi:signal transduction histidine kinase/phage shock protein PspC (stress-responsive transcriptional regulator)